MFKRYQPHDERMLHVYSDLMFEEISSGVYRVTKDRHEKFLQEFVSEFDVIAELNKLNCKVSVGGIHTVYANFDLEKMDFKSYEEGIDRLKL